MKCTKCDTEKSEDEFAWKSKTKGKKSTWCNSCHSDYAKDHYNLNTVYYKEKSARHRPAHVAKNRSYANTKKNVPCVGCGKNYPPHVMDFDHLNNKEFN